jgi:CRISPR system Cascade subunit CasD
MPHILLLRLSGPMQSWGVSSRFSRRDTGKEPSKSGVIGLLCAALGISREDADVEKNKTFRKLTKLRMGVRVLHEGVLQSDYHTAQKVAKADGKEKDTELSTRFYMADADFVVSLESDDSEILETVQQALKKPKWHLFLGRKAFVPDLPVYFPDENVIEVSESLEDFLKSEKLTRIIEKYNERFGKKRPDTSARNRLVIESEEGSERRCDVPLSFSERRFINRRVKTDFLILKQGGEENE